MRATLLLIPLFSACAEPSRSKTTPNSAEGSGTGASDDNGEDAPPDTSPPTDTGAETETDT
jgi:hypothetical protein